MAELLVDRVRAALASVIGVEEKKMFGGLAFMVDGKMCVTVNKNRLLVRVDPALTDTLAARPGAEIMVMGGRTYRGYIRVDEDHLRSDRELGEWISLATDYNSRAPASARKKRKATNG